MKISLKFAMTTIAIFMAVSNGSACAQANKDVTYSGKSVTRRYSEKDLLKNWAFCTCMAQVSRGAQDRDDASATASAYREAAKQPPEVFDAIQILTKRYIDRTDYYDMESRTPFHSMKCIDLFVGKPLDQLVNILLKKNHK